MAEPHLPRHADPALDQAGLRAAQLLERVLDELSDERARARFLPYRAWTTQLRDAHGTALRKGVVAVRAALGPGDGLADVASAEAVIELREALDEILRILNRREALRGRVGSRDGA
ncbi:hypothetical protein EBU60_00645 [bacterium]|jgi:hypothetical protein|nr:hypothetical protein [bacterium]